MQYVLLKCIDAWVHLHWVEVDGLPLGIVVYRTVLWAKAERRCTDHFGFVGAVGGIGEVKSEESWRSEEDKAVRAELFSGLGILWTLHRSYFSVLHCRTWHLLQDKRENGRIAHQPGVGAEGEYVHTYAGLEGVGWREEGGA